MFNEVANKIGQEQETILVEEVIKNYEQQIDEEVAAKLMAQSSVLYGKIEELIQAAEYYDYDIKLREMSQLNAPLQTIQKLRLHRDNVLRLFFEVQNLINEFLGQVIKITYVHIDPITNRREIHLMDNDIKNIDVKTGHSSRGRTWQSLSYDSHSQFQKLKNSLPDEKNESLENTVINVDHRYNFYKHKVLWRLGDEWKGYKFATKGPINEAYVNFYINNIQFLQDLEQNIDIFMLDPKFGVVTADNANGFLLGDTSIGGAQFAIKGAGGGPQNITQIIKALKVLYDNFSPAACLEFINRFKNVEREKASSQLKNGVLSRRSIGGVIGYYGEELMKDITGYFSKKN